MAAYDLITEQTLYKGYFTQIMNNDQTQKRNTTQTDNAVLGKKLYYVTIVYWKIRIKTVNVWNDQFCNSEATSTGYQKGDGSFNEKQIEYGILCRSDRKSVV